MTKRLEEKTGGFSGGAQVDTGNRKPRSDPEPTPAPSPKPSEKKG